MDVLTLVILSIGLAMDAIAVSVSNGISIKKMNLKKALIASLTFGFFQALMPVIGFFAGTTFASFVESFDHFIAFGLLLIIGVNMIFEAVKEMKNPTDVIPKEKLSFKLLMIQGVATSIDALAVGISFAVTDTNIWIASLIIGLVTLGLSLVAFCIGKKFGDVLKQKATIFGALVLIFIGTKILIEHLFFM